MNIEDLPIEFVELSNVPDFEKAAGEVYDMLCLLVHGEASPVVQGTMDMNGFEAWRRLHRKYNPTTPARALQAMIEVMTPSKTKGPRELLAAIEKCDHVLWGHSGPGFPKRGGAEGRPGHQKYHSSPLVREGCKLRELFVRAGLCPVRVLPGPLFVQGVRGRERSPRHPPT